MTQINNSTNIIQPQALDRQFNAGDTYKLKDGAIVKEGISSKISNFFKSFTASGRAEIAAKNQAVLYALLGTTTKNTPTGFIDNLRNNSASLNASLSGNASKMLTGAALKEVNDLLSFEVTNSYVTQFRMASSIYDKVSTPERIILSTLAGLVADDGTQKELLPIQAEKLSTMIVNSLLSTELESDETVNFSAANNLIKDIKDNILCVGDLSVGNAKATLSTLNVLDAVMSKLEAHKTSQMPTMAQQGAEDLNIAQQAPNNRLSHLAKIIKGEDTSYSAASNSMRSFSGVTTDFNRAIGKYIASCDFTKDVSFFRANSSAELSFRGVIKSVAAEKIESFHSVLNLDLGEGRTLGADFKKFKAEMDDPARANYILEISNAFAGTQFDDIKELLTISFTEGQNDIIKNVMSNEKISDANKSNVINQKSKELASAILLAVSSAGLSPTSPLNVFNSLAFRLNLETSLPALDDFLANFMGFNTVQ